MPRFLFIRIIINHTGGNMAYVSYSLQKGFSLIELMIVIGLVGILVVIALPSYTDYVARAQVSEGIQLAASMKSHVEEAYADKGSLPISVPVGAKNDAGNYVDIVSIDENGVITAKFRERSAAAIQGQTVALTPSFAPGGLSSGVSTVWMCGGTVDNKYLPLTCKQ